MTPDLPHSSREGILLVDKPKGSTSFRLVQVLRKRLGIQKIGHAGTLDPFATGLMIMLIGRTYTRLSDTFLCASKEYVAEVYLGAATDTYDVDGVITAQSSVIPSLEEIMVVLESFQGECEQIPPMFSAKKKQGQKLYELARKGIVIPREAVKVNIETHFISYNYPYLILRIVCSKGTYIRSIAHDLGELLSCGAHLTNLRRTRSGFFDIKDAINETELNSPTSILTDRYQPYDSF